MDTITPEEREELNIKVGELAKKYNRSLQGMIFAVERYFKETKE